MSLGLLPTPHLPPGGEPPCPPNSASPPELEAHPGLARLLQNLGGVLGWEGLSPHLHGELAQAHRSLLRARALWLPLELLWRLLGELIRDPRGVEPPVLRALEQELTWAQVRRGPPAMARLLPPRQPPPFLPRLLPELERRLREKREELQNFLLGPPKTSQNPPKNPQNPPKNTQNPPKNTQNPQNPPKNPQNPPKNPQNPPKNTPNPPQNAQNPPKTSQNPPKNTQNPPKNLQNPQNPPKNPPNPPKTTQNPPKTTQNPPKNPPNPPKNSQNPPPNTQNPPKNPENPSKNTQNPPKNPQNVPKNPQNPPQNLQNPPKNTQNPPQTPQILPPTPQNVGGALGAQRLRLRRERLRERRLRGELQRLGWKYPLVLLRCVSHLCRAQALRSLQAHLERGRGRYLLAKGGAVLLKGRLEELRVLLDSYPSPTIEAHRRIRAGLSEGLRAAQSEAAALWAELGALRALGAEFRGLAQEMGRVRAEQGRKRWALGQLRPL